MPKDQLGGAPMPSTLVTDLLAVLDRLAGGVHPGFRPAHAKGQMFGGTFVPSPGAAKLTRAPHATRPSTPVTVRFSLSAGIPNTPDNAAPGSSPQGMAVRFHLAEHVHTDIIAHSINGFAVRSGEEFLEFLRAAAASGPGSANPPPIAAFLATHPAAKAFVEAPRPIPASYAAQTYFAITAFKFTNGNGQSRFGRFRLRPESTEAPLTPEQAAKKSENFLADEMTARLAKGPVGFRVVVQLAEAGDKVDDATAQWPESRTMVEFGTISITERVDELAPKRHKIIFDPLPRVDGIDSAGDPLTDLRADIYLLSGRRRRSS
jgi:catalase